MISLYLARHGQTEENIARIFQGHLPGRLTVEGISQAEVLRDSLKRIPLDAVVSSDLKRCMDTAEIVMEGRELPWETTSLLREIDWGSWTGLRIKEVDLHHIPGRCWCYPDCTTASSPHCKSRKYQGSSVGFAR